MNEWRHFTVIYRGPDTPLNVYLDGELVDQDTDAIADSYVDDKQTFSPEILSETFGQFAIGSQYTDLLQDNLSSRAGSDFLVDEMLMWDEALNETQVQALFGSYN